MAGPGEVPGYAGDRPLWPTPRRIAYLGSKVWLDTCAPTAAAFGLQPRVFPAAADPAAAIEAMRGFDPDVAVLIDPPAIAPAIQRELADGRRDFATLGVLVGGLPADQGFDPASCDRLVSFDTTVTGKAIGDATVWRAIPAPVSDALFADVRPLHRAARVLSIGRSSDHRERMLAAAKHHHDLLQLLHGVSGDQLVEVMADYDVEIGRASCRERV